MRELLDLYQSAQVDRRIAELHEFVQPTLDELVAELRYRRAFVALLDADLGTLQEVASVNLVEGTLEQLPSPAGEIPGPLALSLKTGKPLKIDDALRDSRVPDVRREYYARLGLLSFAVIPLLPA